MTVSTVDVTDTWQQIATGVCTITIISTGNKRLLFNEIASDTGLYPTSPQGIEAQYRQDENKPTFVRSTSDGDEVWSIRVDEAGA
jgi:hypothetical protein